MKRIRPEVLKKLRDNDAGILRIAIALRKRWRTIFIWLLYNNENLTAPAILTILREETGLTDEEILEEVEEESHSKKAVA
jgi:hypothetical protein